MPIYNIGISSVDPRRRNEICRLPQAYEKFFTSDQRGAVSAVEYKTHRATGTGDHGGVRPMQKEQVTYFVLPEGTDMNMELIAKLSVLGYSPIYRSGYVTDSLNPDLKIYLGGYLTILNAYCTKAAFEASGVGAAYYANDVQLIRQELSIEQLDQAFRLVWSDFCLRTNLGINFEAVARFCAVIALSFLLFLIKRLNANSVEKWFNNRWRAIGGQLSPNVSTTSVVKPQFESMNALNSYINTCTPARNKLFFVLKSLAHQQNGVYRPIFAALIKNMWWAEMTHIGMIDKHVMRKNPDIFAMTEFQMEEKSVLTAAYELLYTFPEADRPFIRFYLDHNECYILQSKNPLSYTLLLGP